MSGTGITLSKNKKQPKPAAIKSSSFQVAIGVVKTFKTELPVVEYGKKFALDYPMIGCRHCPAGGVNWVRTNDLYDVNVTL